MIEPAPRPVRAPNFSALRAARASSSGTEPIGIPFLRGPPRLAAALRERRSPSAPAPAPLAPPAPIMVAASAISMGFAARRTAGFSGFAVLGRSGLTGFGPPPVMGGVPTGRFGPPVVGAGMNWLPPGEKDAPGPPPPPGPTPVGLNAPPPVGEYVLTEDTLVPVSTGCALMFMPGGTGSACAWPRASELLFW